jgi:hypothetical protein
LEVKVHIEIHVAISFGLEIFASIIGAISISMEVIMENSIAMFSAVVACFWCGIAFLRSSGEKKIPTQMRDNVFVDVLPSRGERRRFDSSSPHYIFHGVG